MLALLNSIAYQHTAHGVAPTRIDSATLSHGFARGAIAHVKHTVRRAAPKMSRSFALPRPLQQGVTRAATHQRRRRNLRLHTYHTLSQPLPPPPRTTTLTTTPQPHNPPHAMSTPSNAMTTRPHHRRRYRRHHHRRRQHLTRTLTRRNRRPTTLPPPPSSHTRRPPPARNGGTHTHHHRAHTRTPSPRRLHPAPRMHEAVTAHAHAAIDRYVRRSPFYTHDGLFDNFGPRVQVAGSIARGRGLRRGFAMLHATLGPTESAFHIGFDMVRQRTRMPSVGAHTSRSLQRRGARSAR